MIAELSGTLLDKGIDRVVVDVGGVGYSVMVSLQTLADIGPPGAPVRLRTYLQVRQDALVLFGFATEEERTAFELLIGVQQVGPKLALSILSTLAAGALGRAVREGDHARLVRVPGVGKKTAERLVLELKDKFPMAAPGSARPPEPAKRSPAAAQVVSALVNLGYGAGEAERAVDQAAGGATAAGVEQLLKQALRLLAE